MKKPQKQADEFNAKYPNGARVRYWKGAKEGEPSGEGVMKYGPAQVLSGHTAVIWIEGCAGCVALSHIEVVEKLEVA